MTLKQMRIESGLKSYKVAEILGITRQQFRNLEIGKYKMDKLKIEKLGEVYGKEIVDIERALEGR